MRRVVVLACVVVAAACSKAPPQDLFGDPPVIGTPGPSQTDAGSAMTSPTPGRSRSSAVVRAPDATDTPREPTPVPTPVPLPAGVILGHATTGNGLAVAGVCVQAYDVATGLVAIEAVTDATGLYRLIGAPGRYTVRVCETSLLSSLYFATGAVPAIVDVRYDGVRNVDVALPKKGTLRGHVTGDLGVPLAGVCVEAYDVRSIDDPDGEAAPGIPFDREDDVTDLLGNYRLDVDAASYVVRFTPCELPASALGYEERFFDDEGAELDADVVSVRAGGTTRIDESLIL
jgi:hypothetical protein